MSWLRNSIDREITEKMGAEDVHFASVGVLERPAPMPLIAPKPAVDIDGLADKDWLVRYRQTCDAIGRHDEGLMIEEFRHFLVEKDLPVFNREEVVAYMDKIAAKENESGFGWNWVPVRVEDSEVAMTFGTPSQQHYRTGNKASSDYYHSTGAAHIVAEVSYANNFTSTGSFHGGFGDSHMAHRMPITTHRQINPPNVYRHTIPLHALDKIATIEGEFGKGKVVFLVSDYTHTAHLVINPDPFLMAVVPNSNIAHGKGRFVIDLWDEPGFGMAQRLGV